MTKPPSTGALARATRLAVVVALAAGCNLWGGPAVVPPQPDALPAAAPASADAFGSYTLRFPDPQTQYFEVELVLEASEPVELTMAAWTPGSYKIRDYARHIDRVVASTQDGTRLPARKTDKDSWIITPPGEEPSTLVVRYRVYAHTMSVRGNWVEPDFAMLNGAPTFLVPAGRLAETYDVRIESRDAWPDISTALPAHPSGAANRFRVGHYDVLVDSPIVLGDSTITSFEVGDPADPSRIIPHHLVVEGHEDAWDSARSTRDVERITREIVAFWGGIPYDEYTYLNMVVERGGGLEHKASTLMMARSFDIAERDSRTKWLGLVSHEFFHTWNVKRLRPAGLGPFDLSQETYTPSLWVAEGLTSYYDDLLLRRAGLLTDDEYLARMSENIRRLQAKPGRLNRSLEDASRDAWIKYYERDENHDNVSISYYTKGAVVGFLLDAEIREKSGGYYSLDDAMRLAYTRHSGETGYTAADFQAVCEEVAGESLAPFFDRYVRGTEELDYSTAERIFGLRFAGSGDDEDGGDEDGKDKDDAEPGWLGVSASGGPRATVSSIVKDSPAWGADLIAGDEIIAVNQHRVSGSLDALLARFPPGTEVTLTLARRGHLRTAAVTLGERPDTSRWTLEIDKAAPIEARDVRARWWSSAVPDAQLAALDDGEASDRPAADGEADDDASDTDAP